LNVELAKEKLDWSLLYDNHQIVEKTIAWYQSFDDGHSAEEITNKQIQEYLKMIS
jgi:hypothetical protein